MSKPAGESFVSVRMAATIVISIWLSITVFNIPLALWSGLTTDSSSGIVSCGFVAANGLRYDVKQTVFIACSRIVDYFLPLTVNWMCYIGIIRKFKKSLSKVYIRRESMSPYLFVYKAIINCS